jgi:dipeptidyl aminopeptidase/acylaminoacyl peptidase
MEICSMKKGICGCMLALIALRSWPAVSEASAAISTPSIDAADSVADKPANRVLPLRGEAMLKRLLQPMPAIYEIKIAPDGSKAAYFETELARFQTGMFPNSVSMTALRVVDLSSGRSKELPLDVAHERLSAFPKSSPVLQWSCQGREVATLSLASTSPSLIIWDISTGKAKGIPLDQIQLDSSAKETIDSWAWLPENNQLVLGITRPSAQHPSREHPTALPLEPKQVWFMSRAPAWRVTADEAERVLRPAPGELRIISVNLASGQPESIQIEDAVGSHAMRGAEEAVNFDQSSLVILPTGTGVCKKLPRYTLQRHEWEQGRSGGLPGTRGMPANGAGYASLWDLDLTRHTVRWRYTSSTRRITTLASTPDRQSVILAEGERFPTGEPFSWPAPGYMATLFYGHLRELKDSAVQSESLDPSYTDISTIALFAADRPQVLYQMMPTGPESRLVEWNMATNTRRRISPEDFSVTFLDVSSDGRRLVAVLENLNTPSELYTWNTSERRWRPLTDFSKKIGRLPLAKFTTLRWRSRDDRFDLDGLLLTPAAEVYPSQHPLIVMAHGGHWPPFTNVFGWAGTAFGDGSAIAPYVLVNEGYVVFQPNYRGTQGYSYDFAGLSSPDQWYEDIDSGVDAAVASGWADASKVGIVGHSAGSFPLAFALQHPERYKAAINNDGIGLLPQYNRLLNPLSPGYIDDLYRCDTVQEPPVDPFWMRVPLLFRLADLKQYLTVDQSSPLGDSDREIMPLQIKVLQYALGKNRVPFDVLADQDRHTIDNKDNLLEYQSRMVQWFDYFVRGKGENPIPAMDSPLGFKQLSTGPAP